VALSLAAVRLNDINSLNTNHCLSRLDTNNKSTDLSLNETREVVNATLQASDQSAKLAHAEQRGEERRAYELGRWWIVTQQSSEQCWASCLLANHARLSRNP
jgi:hypothetical protein